MKKAPFAKKGGRTACSPKAANYDRTDARTEAEKFNPEIPAKDRQILSSRCWNQRKKPRRSNWNARPMRSNIR